MKTERGKNPNNSLDLVQNSFISGRSSFHINTNYLIATYGKVFCTGTKIKGLVYALMHLSSFH